MLTLLKKRQDRAAIKAALTNPQEQEIQETSGEPTVALSASQSDPFANKSWDEVQRILETDLGFVRTLAGFEEKNTFRKELIKKYKEQADHLLATRVNLEGIDLLWWYYMWQVDCGLLDLIHDDFRASISRGLSTPQKWNSNGEVAYCDVIFKYSDSAYKAKVAFNHTYLSQAITDITEGKLAINAPLKVKMFRLAGKLLDEAGAKEGALALFEAVMQMDPNRGGCKKRLQELKEELEHEQE
ncbi:phage terminase small subunit [Aliivibrio salmonicida]|uniref:phage terminase small subunit n=1 Tax=Aliivibrio salmonicida TaxID=40269 RepID=UPI00406D185C